MVLYFQQITVQFRILLSSKQKKKQKTQSNAQVTFIKKIELKKMSLVGINQLELVRVVLTI